MYKIIDTRGTGKTSRLMLIAKENDALFVCANPASMRQKAYSYGITGIEFVSYDDIINYAHPEQKIVIDELDCFVNHIISGVQFIGYTVSKD
jgi:hypothetical protein